MDPDVEDARNESGGELLLWEELLALNTGKVWKMASPVYPELAHTEALRGVLPSGTKVLLRDRNVWKVDHNGRPIGLIMELTAMKRENLDYYRH